MNTTRNQLQLVRLFGQKFVFKGKICILVNMLNVENELKNLKVAYELSLRSQELAQSYFNKLKENFGEHKTSSGTGSSGNFVDSDPRKMHLHFSHAQGILSKSSQLSSLLKIFQRKPPGANCAFWLKHEVEYSIELATTRLSDRQSIKFQQDDRLPNILWGNLELTTILLELLIEFALSFCQDGQI